MFIHSDFVQLIYRNVLLDQAYKDDESYAFLESYLKSIDYDFKDDKVDAEHYVSHPVGA